MRLLANMPWSFRGIRFRKQELSFEQLFMKNPLPMWIYDTETLEFLEANDAAISKYGYSREEFLGMLATQIRPESEVDRFLNSANPGSPFFSFDGVWKHKFKNGETADMEIFANAVRFHERPAVVVTAHDITERKRSAQTIHLQMNALEAAANGIVITDLTGAIVWANRSFGQMTGYSPDEAVSKNLRELVKSGKQDSSFYKDMWETILAGGVWHGELVNRRKDGSIYDEEMIISPIRGDTGEITHFVAIKQDVTKRKDMERAIAESEKRLHDLTDFLPQIIYEVDESGNITFSNQTGFQMFQVEKEDFKKGLNIMQYVAPEDRQRAKEDIARALKTGKTSSGVEYKMVRKDGTTFTAIEYGNLIYRDGKAVGVRGLVVDITAQKEAERVVVNLKNRFETIFNNTRDAIVLVGLDGVIDCNSAATELFRGTKEEILSSTIERLSPEFQPDGAASRVKSIEKISSALQGQPQFFEWRHKRIDGTTFDAEVSLSRIVLDGKDAVLGAVRDVTERKALEAQLRQSQRLESVGQLTSGIAHDFNNVLGGIIGFSELALRKIDNTATVRTYLERINDLADRAARITRQLLAFSRKQFLQPRDLSMNELIADFLQFIPRLIKESVQVKFIPEPKLKTVRADRSQIEQVLINLSVNASDAMPNGGELVFSTRNVVVDESTIPVFPNIEHGEYVVLSVSDTGTGIEKSVMERIFEPFFTTKGIGKGTGLGLSVVDGIVKQHQGTVNVQSELGKGTTFEVYLPSVDEEPEDLNRGNGELPLAKDRSEKILVVEDNVELRELLTAALRENGYAVVHAENGEEGLRLFNSGVNDISLVISDVLMPKMSGGQLRDKIRQKDPRMRFLFMSGYVTRGSQNELDIEPDVDFIQKPFGISEISIKVREILDRK